MEQSPHSSGGNCVPGRPASTLADVDIRAVLAVRPRRPASHEREHRALAALAKDIAGHPRDMLQTLAEVALDLCNAHTAGVSLLDGDLVHWHAVAGALAGAQGRTTPRHESPCCVCIERDTTQLMHLPDRCFPGIAVEPRVVEALFVPFHADGAPIGTVWIASHAVERTFDGEDERLLHLLAEVVAVARQLRDSYETGAHHRTLDEVRRSEAYLAEGQKISHTGTWAVKPASGDVYWSDEMFRIYGLDPRTTTLSQSMAFQLIHPEDRARVKDAFASSVRNKADYAVEHRASVNGTTKYLHALGHPVFDAGGEVIDYVGTVVDVTDWKHAEQRTRESERRFRRLADAIPHHVWSFSPDGALSYWNERILDYTGLTPDELQQGAWGIVHPGDIDRVQAAWRQACVLQAPYQLEQRLRGRDGRYRRFLHHAVPVRDAEGRVIEWYSTNSDIEERHTAEQALRDAQTQLARVTHAMALGELSASIAHELNQPLAAIVANSAAGLRWLEKREPRLDEATQALHRVIRDAHRAGDVIRHIRALFQKAKAAGAPVDLREIVREVMVFVQPQMTTHGIVVDECAPADLPQVVGVRLELQQLALNLITNAIESMAGVSNRSRNLMIRYERRPLEGGPGVLVAVRDSGTGLAPDTLNRLFEPFFTTKTDGLGMGLSICRTIVEAHGGRLWADNNAGLGATFQFVLPACVTDS